MKILLVLHFKLDRSAGAAGVVLALADEFRAVGHCVTVLSSDSLERFPSILRSILFPFYVTAKLLSKQLDVDVIEASSGDCWIYYWLRGKNSKTLNVTFSQGLYRPLHNRLMQKKSIGLANPSWKYWLFRGSFELWQEAISLRVADRVYVLNTEERRFATEDQRIDAARVKIVRNGLGDHFRDRARVMTATTARPGRHGIVQVGSYEDRKGIAASVAALTVLLDARQELYAAFLGTTHSEQLTYKDFPERLHHRIKVLPHFNNAELPDLLAAYDIFIMPSAYEAFGIAPLEAMACGLVPIVTDIAGPAEYMVNEVNGLTIPVDSPGSLVTAIMRLVDDKRLYDTLRTGALATVLRYEWSEIARERLEDYQVLREAKARTQVAKPRFWRIRSKK